MTASGHKQLGLLERALLFLRTPRWWLDALLATWILVVIVVYFRLQLLRLLEVAQAQGR